jgi:predicted Zn-dependent protease
MTRMFRTTLGGSALLLFLLPAARADDIIRSSGGRITGVTIRSATYEEVTYKAPRIAQTQRLKGEDVEEIVYTKAPGLEAARTLLRQGSWQEASAAFDKAMRLDPLYADAGAFGKAEVAFWWFLETGDAARGEQAIQALEAYLTEYRDKKGFYVPRALYLLGKASLEAKVVDAAAKRFDELAALPGESRKQLAELGKGQVALARGNAKQASLTFNNVLRRARTGKLPLLYRHAMALRGKALVAEKRYGEAVDELEKYLRDLKEDEVVFDRYNARTYNALGDAYAGKGGTENEWEALYRYLWTTVVFRSWRAEAAEAFFKASQLAKKLGETADANRLQGILTGEYSDTLWAKKVQ